MKLTLYGIWSGNMLHLTLYGDGPPVCYHRSGSRHDLLGTIIEMVEGSKVMMRGMAI